MKKANRYCLGIFLCFAAMVGCQKDNDSKSTNPHNISTNSSIQKGTSPTRCIGFYSEKEGTTMLNFDLEEFYLAYSAYVDSMTRGAVVFQDILIEDDDYTDPQSDAYIRMSFYNIEEEYTLTTFIEVEKVVGDTTVYYTDQPNGDSEHPLRSKVTCKGENCENGCDRVKVEGVVTCSRCINENGKCIKSSEPLFNWDTIISACATFFGSLLGSLIK